MGLFSLVACGEFGLMDIQAPERPAREDARTDGGTTGDTTGDAAPADGADEPEVTVPLEGRTWSVDLATVNFTSPPGIGSLVDLLDSTKMLFDVIDESSDRLSLVVAMAGADGAQNPCERVLTLPPAVWENPVFTIDDGDIRLTVGGGPMDVRAALLTAEIAADGSEWSDGVLDGIIDARQVNAGLGDGWDVCDLVSSMGGACEACDDGEEQCFELRIESINAQPVTTGFDPLVDDGAC
jgi:hypothetical protein